MSINSRFVSLFAATAALTALTFVTGATFAGCAQDGGAEAVVTHSAALSTPTADECVFITHGALSDLLVPIDQAIELSDIDKAANGVTGAYASAANAANDYLHTARAKVLAMDDSITQNGNPIYSMGPWYSFGSVETWNQLDAATWYEIWSAAAGHEVP